MSSYNWPPQGSSGGGVTSLNTLTGDIILAAGANVTLTPVGNTITIASSGSGDVVGPSSATNNAIVRFDTTTGKLIKNSTAVLDDSGNVGFAGVVVAGQVIDSGLNINTVPYTDSNKQFTSSAVTPTELGYVSGVTSAIQTQLNGKQATLTIGNLIDAGTDGITITGGTGSVIGSGASIAQHVSDSTHNGYLSSTDWVTFNGKGSGTVTSVSVVSTNGFAGTVATSTSTPAITISTTITGLLIGNGTAVSAATTTGSGSVVLATAPTMTNPVVGTQSQGDTSTKAASTAYVDTAVANAVAGVNPAVAVQAATTAASDTSGFTYNNGASGIGATLTGAVNTALTVDGYTFTALAQRLLVKNDTQSPSGAFNGVYYVTQVQTAILPLILTRALDYDMPSDMNNTGAIPVINGTVNGTTSWVLTSLVVTVGTTPLTFTRFTRNPADYLLVASNLSDVASKSTSFNNLSPMTTGGDIIYGGASGTGTRLANGSAGQVLTSAGTTLAPTWSTVSTTAVLFNGNHANDSSWARTSSTFGDPTGDATSTFNTVTSSGLGTVVSATSSGNNIPGIVFTPTSSTKSYYVQARGNFITNASGLSVEFKLTDGTIVIDDKNLTVVSGFANARNPITLEGLYTPGTTSPVTIKVQWKNSDGTTTVTYEGLNSEASVYWSVWEVH